MVRIPIHRPPTHPGEISRHLGGWPIESGSLGHASADPHFRNQLWLYPFIRTE
jgi:hypothetical protein